MPRYRITIGNSQIVGAYAQHTISAPLPRRAMTIAHRALLQARATTETGKDYNYWTVSEYNRTTGDYRFIHHYLMP